YVDNVDTGDVTDYEQQLLDFLRDSHGEILAAIRDEQQISDETDQSLQSALDRFNENYEPRERNVGANIGGGDDSSDGSSEQGGGS
ncbi:MAG: hypothetical protein L0G70_00930, partial [Rubrobacter sp.]|nr:hypothetical protein [Rubrobacter sp.]